MTTYPNKFCIVVSVPTLPRHFNTTKWKEVQTKKELEDYLDELSDMGYVIDDIYTEEETRF